MKTYNVTLPITGYAVVCVEAESEDDAIEKAMESVTLKDIQEWEACEQVVQGNVFHGVLNNAEAELEDGDDDDEDEEG